MSWQEPCLQWDDAAVPIRSDMDQGDRFSRSIIYPVFQSGLTNYDNSSSSKRTQTLPAQGASSENQYARVWQQLVLLSKCCPVIWSFTETLPSSCDPNVKIHGQIENWISCINWVFYRREYLKREIGWRKILLEGFLLLFFLIEIEQVRNLKLLVHPTFKKLI